MSVGVVLVCVGWYRVGGSVHPTPAAMAKPVASSPASAGAEILAGPEPRPSPQTPPTQPVVPSSAPVPAEETGEKPTVPAPVVGRLLVRSTPSGAQVFVDDQESGLTPATIRDLAVRTHRVRVVRDGYLSEERRVPLTVTRPAQSMTFELEQGQASASVRELAAPLMTTGTWSGSLSVDSHPAGAQVYIDGQLVGKTPVSLPQIQAGTHVIRLELDAYRGWSSSVRVVRGGRTRVTGSLEEAPGPESAGSPNTGVRRDGREDF
jgi:PEGA domain-containing protein